MDPHPENNQYGFQFFRKAVEAGSGTLAPLVLASDPEEALGHLRRERFDLVISHWGGPPDDSAAGARLLLAMRAEGLRAPVLIFAANKEVDARKRLALSLGAQGYCFRFETLFRRIEEVLSDAFATG